MNTPACSAEEGTHDLSAPMPQRSATSQLSRGGRRSTYHSPAIIPKTLIPDQYKPSFVTTTTQPYLTRSSVACLMVLIMVTEDHDSLRLPPNSLQPFLIRTSFLLASRRPASGRRQWAPISAFHGSSLLGYRYRFIPKEVRKVSPSPSFALAPLGQRINDAIPSDEFSLHNVPVDNAISFISQHGPGAYLAKVDIKSAFRNYQVRWKNWPLLYSNPQHRVGQQVLLTAGSLAFVQARSSSTPRPALANAWTQSAAKQGYSQNELADLQDILRQCT